MGDLISIVLTSFAVCEQLLEPDYTTASRSQARKLVKDAACLDEILFHINSHSVQRSHNANMMMMMI